MKIQDIDIYINKYISFFLRRLMKKKYIEGVVLLGGLGKRNFFDRYSDIDISIFYNSSVIERNTLPFEFHFTYHKKIYEFNIHQLIIENEINNHWNESKRQAYKNGRIIFDRKGSVAGLIESKIIKCPKESLERLIWIIEQYEWRSHIHSIRSFLRGFPESSHLILNECIELLIEAIYIINNSDRPHSKWKLYEMKKLEWIPKNCMLNFKKSLIVKSFTLNNIKHRINISDKIFFEIKNKAREIKGFPCDAYKYYYENYIQLYPNPWISVFIKSIEKHFDRKKSREIKGFLCLNLISSKKQLQDILTVKNKNIIKINEKIRKKLLKVLSQ